MEKQRVDLPLLCTYLMGFVLGVAFTAGRLVGIVRVRGLRNFPHGKQGMILASNHPYKGEQFLLIALFFPRYLYHFGYGPWTMADMENYFEKFPWRLFRSRLISVNRTGRLTGVSSLDVVKDVLEHGGNIIIFPQGTRTGKVREEDLLKSPNRCRPIGPLKAGFARLVLEVPGTKVVPVYSEINSWRDIRFTVGEPMTFAGGTSREEIKTKVQDRLLELADAS